jgi:hypothetical protein
MDSLVFRESPHLNPVLCEQSMGGGRVNLDFPTFLVKVRAHRGQHYNEAADRLAYTATNDEDVPLL